MLETTVNSQFQFDKSLILWATIKGESGTTYYVVSDIFRNEYHLWKGSKKTKWSSDNPLDLNKYIK